MKKIIILLLILLTACSSQPKVDAPKNLDINSVFQNGKKIPKMYTCDGKNINPYLNIENVPENSKSLVIILEDPDAPKGTHWVAFNIQEDELQQDYSAQTGINDFGSVGYAGPCPPKGTQRYYFRAYSLDKKLSFSNRPKQEDVFKKMQGHVLAWGELMGKYR